MTESKLSAMEGLRINIKVLCMPDYEFNFVQQLLLVLLVSRYIYHVQLI